MTRLTIIRHAQASLGADDYDRLSGLGERQSTVLGRFLATTGIGFDAIRVGDLARHQRTAQLLLAQFNSHAPALATDPDFNEFDAFKLITGALPELVADDPSLAADAEKMMTERESFKRVFATVVGRWQVGEYDDPDMETWDEFQARVRTAFARAAEVSPGGNVLVVTSGGPILNFFHHVTGMPRDEVRNIGWYLRNASITTFLHNHGKFTLESFNSVAHFEAAGDPSLLTYI